MIETYEEMLKPVRTVCAHALRLMRHTLTETPPAAEPDGETTAERYGLSPATAAKVASLSDDEIRQLTNGARSSAWSASELEALTHTLTRFAVQVRGKAQSAPNRALESLSLGREAERRIARLTTEDLQTHVRCVLQGPPAV